jgi:hypothetical protein
MKVFIEDTIDENGDIKGKLYLESDSMQFMLREYNGKVSDKGVEQSKTHGYYTDVKSALTKLIRMKVMQSNAVTLLELREDIRKIEQAVSSNFDWNAVMKPSVAVGD